VHIHRISAKIGNEMILSKSNDSRSLFLGENVLIFLIQKEAFSLTQLFLF